MGYLYDVGEEEYLDLKYLCCGRFSSLNFGGLDREEDGVNFGDLDREEDGVNFGVLDREEDGVNLLERYRTLLYKKQEEREKKLVREDAPSALRKGWLKKTMQLSGFSAFLSTSFPISGQPSLVALNCILVLMLTAFTASILGLFLFPERSVQKPKLLKISVYCGYVSLFSLLFALGMIAYFTVMWVFERN